MSILPRWRVGKKREAARAETVSVDPASAARQQAAKLVDLANAAEDGGDLALALTQIRKAIEIDPAIPGRISISAMCCSWGGTSRAPCRRPRPPSGWTRNMRRGITTLEGCMASRGIPRSGSMLVKALELRPQFPQAAVALAVRSRIRTVAGSTGLAAPGSCRRPALWGRDFEPLSLAAGGRQSSCGGTGIAARHRHQSRIRGGLVRSWRLVPRAIPPQRCHRLVFEGTCGGRSSQGAAADSVTAQTVLKLGVLLVQENRWPEAAVQLRRAMKLLARIAGSLRQARLDGDAEGRGRSRPWICWKRRLSWTLPAVNLKSFRFFLLNLRDDIDPQELFNEHRRFGEWLEGAAQRTIYVCIEFDRRGADAARWIRLCRLPCPPGHGVHLAPVLEEHERCGYCPSAIAIRRSPTRPRRISSASSLATWRDITSLGDDEVADLVIGGRNRHPRRSFRAHGLQPPPVFHAETRSDSGFVARLSQYDRIEFH